MELKKYKINELKPALYNPRKELQEDDAEFKKIENSIKEFGYVEPIIINYDKTVIGGHQRLNVLKKLGYDEIDCIEVNVDKNKEKALNIALNKIEGEWDYSKLGDLLLDLDAMNFDLMLTGFDDFEIENIIAPISFDENKEIIEDEVPEILEEPKSKYGDIYQLGNHRLMCGDSTKEDDVEKLMSKNIAKCIFTSPPYNMGGKMYENYTDNLESQKYIDFNIKVVEIWKQYLRGYLFWNISYNKNSRWEFIEILYKIVKETGLKFMELIVWDKGHAIPITSKDMLTRQYEDILLVGNKENISEEMELYYLGTTEKRAYFNKKKGKGITNYWRITTENVQLKNHKACFPVKLSAKAINLTTDIDDIVTDCFGGSGSTLIACEQLNRKCYMMELDPHYVDVIIQRWENFTGKKAIKLN